MNRPKEETIIHFILNYITMAERDNSINIKAINFNENIFEENQAKKKTHGNNVII